jgi:transposase InsO family protein
MSKSTFYEVKSKLNDPDKDKDIKEKIIILVAKHHQNYGYRKITGRLRKVYGLIVNHKKVYRIMKELDLLAVVRRRKYKSYKGTVGKVAKNVLKRDFSAKKPNQKWVTDITEFKVCDRKVYLSPVMDLYDRSIISFTYGFSPKVQLVMDMIKKATPNKKYRRLVVHSDQGFQYQNLRFQKHLKKKRIKQSMSRKGNCLDNAVIEYFFGVLKTEFFYRHKFKSIDEFIYGLKDYIEYYNNERVITKLKGMTPLEYRNHSLCLN